MSNPASQQVKKLRETLDDQFPPGYNAHNDRFADEYEHREAVNVLGRALREAVELLEKANG